MTTMRQGLTFNSNCSHNSNRGLSVFTSAKYRFLFILLSMFVFDFFNIIKQDDMVKDYSQHATAIHSKIITPSTTPTVMPATKFGQLDIFPLIVCIGDGKVELIHHIQQ